MQVSFILRPESCVFTGVRLLSDLSSFAAIRELKALSTKQFAVPGEAGFPLGGLFPAPANKTESGERI